MRACVCVRGVRGGNIPAGPGWRRGPGNAVINPGGGPSSTWIIREINLHATYEPGEKHWRRKLYFPDRLSGRTEAATESFRRAHTQWHSRCYTQSLRKAVHMHRYRTQSRIIHVRTHYGEEYAGMYCVAICVSYSERNTHTHTHLQTHKVVSLCVSVDKPLRKECHGLTYCTFSFPPCV